MSYIDFSLVKDTGWEPVPAGDYALRCTAAEEKQGKKAPYVALTLEVMSGEYQGKQIFYNLSLSDGALWRMKEMLRVLGVDVSGKVERNWEKWFLNQVFTATVEVEEYTGSDGKVRKSNNVKPYIPVIDDDEYDDEEEYDEGEEYIENRYDDDTESF